MRIGVLLAAAIDACCVLAFVAIGRASHARGETLSGIASTAWPFLAGLAIGWLILLCWRGTHASHWPFALAPAGVAAWLGTDVAGMTLRVAAGQGTAVAFIVVALAFLGLFLLGWRLLARYIWLSALLRFCGPTSIRVRTLEGKYVRARALWKQVYKEFLHPAGAHHSRRPGAGIHCHRHHLGNPGSWATTATR